MINLELTEAEAEAYWMAASNSMDDIEEVMNRDVKAAKAATRAHTKLGKELKIHQEKEPGGTGRVKEATIR